MSDGDVLVIPTQPDLPFPLGRYGVNHDPANRNWEALQMVTPPERTDKPGQSWLTRRLFDQGSSPRCTAEAATGLLVTKPYLGTFTGWRKYDSPDERQALYLTSQDYDPWPGHDYDGTSTDAPLKVLRERGEISSYRWLFGETQLRRWVTDYGPAFVGTYWLMDMFYPADNGVLSVSGEVAGGHAYRIVQANARMRAYRVVNSWGKSWGQSGRAWIRFDDMARLLADEGDAVTVA